MSSETATGSEGGGESSTNSSPWNLERRCRPIQEVVAETRLKGPLLDRIDRLEDHVLRVSPNPNPKNRYSSCRIHVAAGITPRARY